MELVREDTRGPTRPAKRTLETGSFTDLFGPHAGPHAQRRERVELAYETQEELAERARQSSSEFETGGNEENPALRIWSCRSSITKGSEPKHLV